MAKLVCYNSCLYVIAVSYDILASIAVGNIMWCFGQSCRQGISCSVVCSEHLAVFWAVLSLAMNTLWYSWQ